MNEKRTEKDDFTSGSIPAQLVRFSLPVLLALVLQAMYGAVDMMVVGKFGTSADVSAVATGSQLLTTVTSMIASFSVGITVLLGQQIGMGKGKEGGRTIGAGIVLFFLVGCAIALVMAPGAGMLATVMKAPPEAFQKTTNYIRICGAGAVAITAYNLIGSVFRGIGDSKTPLLTVFIACVVNIAGDLVLCGVFRMGTEGAAIATVLAQTVSVILSLLIVRKRSLGFTFSLRDIRFDVKIIGRILRLGAPIALQELLVGVSFLVIATIVNSLGLIPSAGVGVAEKVCMFLMLVPSAFMQSLSSMVAQNYGAREYGRAYRILYTAILMSLVSGVIMAFLSFFVGETLADIFSDDPAVIAAAANYMKAYAVDCLFTPFLFCYIGFASGIGGTTFVMIQGIVGAFAVRVPLSFLFSSMEPLSLFRIGTATPASSLVQIVMCLIYIAVVKKRLRKGGEEVSS